MERKHKKLIYSRSMERKAIMTPEDIIDSKNEEIARLKNLIKRTQKEIKEILDQECLPTERVMSRIYAMLEI
jgi:hypothetical protein